MQRRGLWPACSLRPVSIPGAGPSSQHLPAAGLEPAFLPCGVWVANGEGLLACATEPRPKLALNWPCSHPGHLSQAHCSPSHTPAHGGWAVFLFSLTYSSSPFSERWGESGAVVFHCSLPRKAAQRGP